MITINLKQKTKKDGHLVLDVPTSLIEKNVEVILVILENEEAPQGNKQSKKKEI